MNLDIRLTGPALLVAAGLAAAAWYLYPWTGQPPMPPPGNSNGTTGMTPGTPTVLPTSGGQLGVATVSATERFISKTYKTFMGIELPLGATESHFQAAVTFRYHIEMEKKWPISINEKTCVVRAGTIKPTLPVAFDTATIQKYTTSGWGRFDKAENLDELERSITAQLQTRASNPQYEQMVTEAARQSVQTFVSTWLLSNHQWGREPEYKVVVLFPGETVASRQAAMMKQPTH